jgi:predicted AlkP superfamily phosphohydrolase/phosphomutase
MGGYHGRLFLNVRGREPQGVVSPADYEGLRDEIAAKLEALPDHRGCPVSTRTFRPNVIYRETRGVAPDLLIYFDDLNWRSVGSVGNHEIYTSENDSGPDGANHDQYGIFILYDPRDHRAGQRVEDISIYDVAPTLLDRLGIDISSEMIGRVREL